MLKLIRCSLVALALFAHAEEEKSIWDYHPIHVGGTALGIGKATLTPKHTSSNGDLQFAKANAFAYCLVPISNCSFFLPRIEYNALYVDWDHNPRFNDTNFHYMQFALSFLTTSLDTWRWITRVDYNIDVDHFSSAREYGLFSALLWGTHDVSDRWRYHIGAFGYTGFSGEEVYPIIGFDYLFYPKWTLQLIFPINYMLEYSINERWRVALKARPLKERFRVSENEPSPKSIFSYSSTGAELNLHYEKFLHLEIEMFAGYNFGGDFYIKDQEGKNPLYTKIKGAPYIGASLNWGI